MLLQHVTVTCHCNMSLQHVTATFHCNISLQHVTGTFHCNISLQHVTATFHCNMLQYRVRQQWREAEHYSPTSCKNKNELSHASTPTYAIILCARTSLYFYILW
jgi:hypothetical protein